MASLDRMMNCRIYRIERSVILLWVCLVLLVLPSRVTSEGNSTNSTGIDYELENLLGLRWKMVQQGVSYEGLRFDVLYTVSDYVHDDLIEYVLYDGAGCSKTSNDITHQYYFNGWVAEDNTPLGSGTGTRTMTLSTQIIPQNISNSNAFVEIDSTQAQIEFCARLSLHNTNASDPASVEINHHETVIRLLVDLQDDFTIQSQVVQAKDKGVETAEDSFFVESYLCTSNGQEYVDTQPIVQGQTVRVCVKPTQQALDIGFRMRSIDRFTFWQGYVSQEAVINQRTSINGLTDLWCDPGDDQCMLETLLMAYFFQGASTVEGDGLATLQFGGSTSSRRQRQRLLRSTSLSQDASDEESVHDHRQRERVLKGGQKSLSIAKFPITSYAHAYSGSLSIWSKAKFQCWFFALVVPILGVVAMPGIS